MKKLLSFLLTAILLVCSVSSAFAAKLDLSPIEAESELYTIDISEDGEAAFIETTLTAQHRSFVHKYESTALYSTTMFDVLVVDYGTSDNYPIIRLWVTYCADDHFQNFDSVTFTVGNKEFTFTDISDPDWLIQDEESGYIEDVLVRFNEDNLVFLDALTDLTAGNASTIEGLNELEVKMVLHGDEDIEATLSGGFLLDFLAIKSAWLDLNGPDYLDQASGSDLSVKTVY